MLYIRTNMNSVIATGHVMRCLSIADAAKSIGENTTFILSDEQAVFYIKERGYQTIVLNTQWDDLESELPILIEVIKQYGINKMLVDSYQVTESYLRELSGYTKVVYLDDLNAFYYPVDGIICYANYWEKFDYVNRYPNTKLWLGTEYMPLREAFSNVGSKKIREKVQSLLLLSGGNDVYHVLDDILERLDLTYFETVTVICGRYNESYEQMIERYAEYENVKIHRAVENMDSYMKEADLAVSAGGTTLYELCACGTPTISYSFVDNQLDNVRQFEKDGIIDYAGDARFGGVESKVVELIQIYANNKELRRECSIKMQKLVDGKGALRIAKALLEDVI